MDYVALEKLKWRSRRSMLELDLYFDRFIQGGGFSQLSEAEYHVYAQLLAMDDGDLLLLLQGKEVAADQGVQQLINKIAQVDFKKEEV